MSVARPPANVPLAAPAVVASRPAAGQRLGRFVLLAELGQGAQATVWRALDERLQRPVALKLLRAGGDVDRADRWLHEARAVARLAHPHIVPVFEADLVDGQAMLVFELVEGQTLADALRRRGAFEPRVAVELMVSVADALRAAHGQGIVHRDLKPSNILIDADGRARVMDFGIAAALSDAGPQDGLAGLVAGTPGYISPEAARAEPPSPLMDVFAAGLVLGELLTGQPMLRETDVHRALARVQTQDLRLADDAGGDDRLRDIVQRAIARDPERRYDSAASLRDALMQWLAPPDDGQLDSGSGHGTLDFLLRRMRYKSDFPALSDGVLRIQRMASSDSETLQSLSDEILKDVALTQKLLRLVNTAHFKRGEQGVGTVSRAVALVGLAGIRNLALSLIMVEHMRDKAHAQRLKEAFVRALLAGQLAHEMAGSPREAEDAFLAALFYNLGPLLAEFYFPDEAAMVRQQVAALGVAGDGRKGGSANRDVLADQIATQVLGLSYEALGMGVARHWALPDALQRCMRRPDGASPSHRLPAGPDRMRWLAVAANEVAELVWQAHDEALPRLLDAAVVRHGRALGLGSPELRDAVAGARRSLADMAPALGLTLPPVHRGVPTPQAAEATTALLPPEPLAAPVVTPVMPPVVTPAGSQSADLMHAGIQDITDSLAGDVVRLNDVLRMVLETIYRALQCDRVLFCLRDAGGARLQGRFGLGEGVAALAPLFQVALRPVAGTLPDLFAVACAKGDDALVPDMSQTAVVARLPAWYRQHVRTSSCLLLPLVLRGATFAMIYADRRVPMALSERERTQLRTLRNQAMMAFRQAGH